MNHQCDYQNRLYVDLWLNKGWVVYIWKSSRDYRASLHRGKKTIFIITPGKKSIQRAMTQQDAEKAEKLLCELRKAEEALTKTDTYFRCRKDDPYLIRHDLDPYQEQILKGLELLLASKKAQLEAL